MVNPMKLRTCALLTLTLCSTAAFAQQGTDSQTTTFQTAQGEVVVHTGQPEARQYAPPPPFAQLDTRGAGYITSNEAGAYPPLANDFIHADGNRDGRVTRAEYERWAKSQ